MRRPRTVRALLSVGLVAGALSVAPSPAYADPGALCEGITTTDTPSDETTDASAPLLGLEIQEAHDRLRRAGKSLGGGVGVAVLDSGVIDNGNVPLAGSYSASTLKAPGIVDYHGTAVAGLIAGQQTPGGEMVGVAPEAEVLDVRVYDAAIATEEAVPVTTAGLVEGLRYVEQNLARFQIEVVNISLAVARDPALDAVIDDLVSKDVIVVAASGNRPQLEETSEDTLLSEFEAFEAGDGEDAATAVWPAGYDDVVAVSSSVPTGVLPQEFVLQNSATDVAAPTAGGVSYGLNGNPCLIELPATSWAAAEVSGVIALLISAYPDDTPQQIVARLTSTATGTSTATSVLTGMGVVQPLEALGRRLEPDKDGVVPGTSIEEPGDEAATAPPVEPDPLKSTRENAAWWGLLGGGLLLVAVLLRPVLARRRA